MVQDQGLAPCLGSGVVRDAETGLVFEAVVES